jgi:hypothetical protein
MQTQNEIKKATKRILEIVDELIQTRTMVKGSYTTVYRKCGKPTCRCAESGEKRHPSTRITWTENGISRTQTVKEMDHDLLRTATESYRKYRKSRRQLRTEEAFLEELLDKHEKENIKGIQH